MPTVGLRPRVRRHLLTLPRSAVKTYLRQASWLMATSDVPPPSHPIWAVAYSSASLRTLTGGRLTNYSGGTAPDSHRISFSARSPRFHNLSRNRGSRATGRHFVSVSVVNAFSVSGRLIPVNPLHRVARTHFGLSLRGAYRRGNLDEVEHPSTDRRCYGDGIAAQRSQ